MKFRNGKAVIGLMEHLLRKRLGRFMKTFILRSSFILGTCLKVRLLLLFTSN